MKKILYLLFVLGLTLSACGTSQTQSAPPAQTSTPSLVSTATQTPIPPTATVTPLPTIPTFTPTFDVSTIVTVTPAERAECPKANDKIKLNFRFDDLTIDVNQEIIDFLNKGGSPQVLANELSKFYSQHSFRLVDITNDGIPDLIFNGFTKLYDTFYILWCQNRSYSVFSGENIIGVAMGNTIQEIVDMNNNGIPEIFIYKRGCTGGGCYNFFVGEWNGETFTNLAPGLSLDGIHEDKIEIKDINHDETLEIILVGGPYEYNVPWRQSIYTYMWDGNIFKGQPTKYVQPVYRFQAIQDADGATLVGKYNNALLLYQEAISDPNLEWWSTERQMYEQAIVDAPWFHEPTPSVEPSKDLTEYPRLAAYAYYRIMLLHLVQGQEAEAASTYQTLQETFGNDPYATPYVEMASVFWEAYQPAKKMYDGCAAAIQYAVEHPEILVPLGSDYHGWQSHMYEPADVCPFR